MSLSRKEEDHLKPLIEKAVNKFLGFSEPTLVTAAINCLDKGYDKPKTVDKLGDILDDSQASKFAEKLFAVYDDYQVTVKAKKRRAEERRYEENDAKKARVKTEETPPAAVVTATPAAPAVAPLSIDKIKEMMASARKTIQERQYQLNAAPPTHGAGALGAGGVSLQAQQHFSDALDKVKKAADLQKRIQEKLASVNLTPVNMPVLASGPTPVIMDAEGRAIDIKTGQAIQLAHYQPTLKANIRAKKREQFRAVQERPPEELTDSKYFDHRISSKAAQRNKRAFKFHEKGKFIQLAQRLRTKAQLEKLQCEIASVAKKTGIASAAKLATIQPKKDLVDDEVPDIEWWDAVILRNESYGSLQSSKETSQFEGITNLVEHPIQMKPPDSCNEVGAEPNSHVEIAIMLTKGERKKLRRQNRTEAQKEIQEKIRLGLLPPAEPKVRMANLMRVLGTEAVQDPTKVEAHVRAQMAKRQRAHEEANASRKLTKEQKRDKKVKKMKEDTSLGVHVSVYRVTDLSNPSKKFKVETNSNQLFMTGMVVLHKDCNVIVVEGGPKQQKKFRKLVLHRIKWAEEKQQMVKSEDDSGKKVEQKKKANSCQLVWEGMVKTRAFGEMKFKMCPTEVFAREQFKKYTVEHYWDLAYSGCVLSTPDDL